MARGELHVLMGGVEAGVLKQDEHGRHEFIYHQAYRADPNSTPLSTSMPLTASTYRGATLDAYLAGLLPDNEDVLDAWATRFDVSAHNPYAMLEHVGEDCAGAVQFVTPARVASLEPGEVHWQTEVEIGDRIRMLRGDPTAWLGAQLDFGLFSLAGAQSKFAILRGEERWGFPRGAIPTTHIVKPGNDRYPEMDLNEHICLETARNLGLRAALSEIRAFDGERVLIVERFDRALVGGDRIRIHQEDGCQAYAVHPRDKYEARGGPGAVMLARRIRDYVEPDYVDADLWRLVSAMAFNWLIGGTDAHAKNYGFLLEASTVRLAPLYDLVSLLPYVAARPGSVRAADGEIVAAPLKMAMKIGSQYEIAKVGAREWTDLAEGFGLAPPAVLDHVAKLANQFAGALAAACAAPPVVAAKSSLPERLNERAARNATRCALALERRPPQRRGRRVAP